jgi:hypothetical protein
MLKSKNKYNVQVIKYLSIFWFIRGRRGRMAVGFTTGRWFTKGTLVSSTNKTDRNDITEI